MSLRNNFYIFAAFKTQVAITINILLEKFVYCHPNLKKKNDFKKWLLFQKYYSFYDYLYLFINIDSVFK